jgi:hypothetical protein
VQALAKLGKPQRSSVLQAAGAAPHTVADVERALLSLPHAHIMRVRARVDGEEDMKEQDLLTVEVWIAITRASHMAAAAPPPGLGKAPAQAFAPRYPHVVKESWCALLASGTWHVALQCCCCAPCGAGMCLHLDVHDPLC